MPRAVLAASLLLLAGCATRPFVRTEVGQAERRLSTAIARLASALGQERARAEQLGRDLAAIRGVADEASRRASEAAGTIEQATAGAEGASARAGEAAERADAARGAARTALEKAVETDRRLTTLWTSRGRRTLTDTVLVHFGFDQWSLDDRAQTALLEVVRQLRAEPRLAVELEGYTDGVGAAAYNLQLSQRRAEAVRRFLVERGVELPRIHAIGLGDVRPVADNKTRVGRDQNRRVAVRLFALAD